MTRRGIPTAGRAGQNSQFVDGGDQWIPAQGYAPFGEPLWNEGSGTTGLGFTGERWEACAQLLFLRARYYEPGTGRFITEDATWSALLLLGLQPDETETGEDR